MHRSNNLGLNGVNVLALDTLTLLKNLDLRSSTIVCPLYWIACTMFMTHECRNKCVCVMQKMLKNMSDCISTPTLHSLESNFGRFWRMCSSNCLGLEGASFVGLVLTNLMELQVLNLRFPNVFARSLHV
jgi:hypothetical protein